MNRFKLLDIISVAATVYEYQMVDRDPLNRWSFERVTLPGDACGSSDVSHWLQWRLVGSHRRQNPGVAISDDRRFGGALEAYEAERKPTINRIVLG